MLARADSQEEGAIVQDTGLFSNPHVLMTQGQTEPARTRALPSKCGQCRLEHYSKRLPYVFFFLLCLLLSEMTLP